MVLEQIIKHKHKILPDRLSAINSYKEALEPSERSLIKALTKHKAYITEIKPASPSQGVLRKKINIEEVAKIYEPFADAISVLADEKFFLGSLNNVKAVSKIVKCPILCKDIVIQKEQIFEARHYGADAILLMMSVLNDDNYKECRKVAASLNMDVITEVHSEEEMKRAIKLNALIIGINNRNLNTLTIDMTTTERLLSLVPPTTLVISESGFFNHQQVLAYRDKVNGFLVGSSLMKSERIDLALRELIFGRVKICGITNESDALTAYEAGAYYGGLNFSSISKRRIDIVEAKNIKAKAPLKWGGIFLDQPVDEVISIANELNLDFVQLHGHEAEDYIRDLRPLLPVDCEIWKAIGVKEAVDISPHLGADLILLDALQNNGSGKSFDWQLINKNRIERFGLAGGINESNAHEASLLNPWLIDIASGAEEHDARKKSPERLRAIFRVLRG